MSTPANGDMIMIVDCLGDLHDYLKSGARPLRKIVVRHKDNGPFRFEAEYTRESRDRRGHEYVLVAVRDQRGEEVVLAQFCKEWIDSVEDQGPVNGAT
jgi:hypothetical protein